MNNYVENWLPAPAEPQLSGGEVHVWRFSLDVDPVSLEACRPVLNEAETARANRFYFPRDRRRFTVGRANLRRILGLYLKQAPADFEFEYGPHGKPSLASNGQIGSDRLEFNLAHSHELALLALTLNNSVGVDLEFIKDSLDVSRLTRQVFTSQEQVRFREIPAARQREAFYNGWTRKEAYMKACGGGLSVGLDQVEVSFVPGEPPRILQLNGDTQLAANWSLTALHPGASYQAALVVEGANPVIKWWDI